LPEIPGYEMLAVLGRGGNGIVESPDGRSLFVSAWSGGEIVRIRRDGRAPPLQLR